MLSGLKIHHVGYAVKDLTAHAEILVDQKLVIADPPRPAVAFGGRPVTFLYKVGVGLLELVESEPTP